MNTDDRVTRYLSERAATITVAPSAPGAIVERALRRRQRRQRVTMACVAVASVAVGGLAVLGDDDGGSSVEIAEASGLVPSALEWTVVEPDVGLGIWATTVTADDGSVYSLSTAPGPPPDDAGTDVDPQHLYRSGDGRDWDEVALPADLWASSLSASGGRLYAVGTSPAGGGREVVITSSADGGANWSDLRALPMDELAALEAAHGADQVALGPPSVVAGPNGTVVAVSIHSVPDVPALAAAAGIDIGEDDAWGYSQDGVQVYAAPEEQAHGETDRVAASTTMPASSGAGPSGEPTPTATYSWDDLGLHPDLRALIGGRQLVFASTDGASFERATIPEGGGDARLLLAPDGFRLVIQRYLSASSEVQVLRSADGRTWEPDAVAGIPGYLINSGQLEGRPALAVGNDTGNDVAIWSMGPDGAWTSFGLASELEPALPDGSVSFGPVAFGPQGIAALVAVVDDDERFDWQLLHSSSGGGLSLVPLRDHLAFDAVEASVTVTADAIVVRTNEPDGDVDTPPHQVLLVGTPPG